MGRGFFSKRKTAAKTIFDILPPWNHPFGSKLWCEGEPPIFD